MQDGQSTERGEKGAVQRLLAQQQICRQGSGFLDRAALWSSSAAHVSLHHPSTLPILPPLCHFHHQLASLEDFAATRPLSRCVSCRRHRISPSVQDAPSLGSAIPLPNGRRLRLMH